MNDRERLGKRVIRRKHVEIYSDVLNLTFRCPVNDPRASRLEMIVSCHEELARQQRTIKPRKRIAA
jgi:hypothetical protein